MYNGKDESTTSYCNTECTSLFVCAPLSLSLSWPWPSPPLVLTLMRTMMHDCHIIITCIHLAVLTLALDLSSSGPCPHDNDDNEAVVIA